MDSQGCQYQSMIFNLLFIYFVSIEAKICCQSYAAVQHFLQSTRLGGWPLHHYATNVDLSTRVCSCGVSVPQYYCSRWKAGLITFSAGLVCHIIIWHIIIYLNSISGLVFHIIIYLNSISGLVFHIIIYLNSISGLVFHIIIYLKDSKCLIFNLWILIFVNQFINRLDFLYVEYLSYANFKVLKVIFSFVFG